MPQIRNSSAPPPAMTWGSAMPILVVAGLFDLVRAFFNMFWFFAPALAGLYCAAKVGDTWLIGKALAAACIAIAAGAGIVGVVITETLGVIMADAVGLIGFLVLILWILMANSRIFKANATGFVWFLGSFAGAEIPFLGTLPMFTIVLWKLYRVQIRVEQAALKKYEEAQAASQLQQGRQQQAAQMMQIRAAQEAQAMQEAQIEAQQNEEETEQELKDQEEVDQNARTTQQELTEEIPEEVRKAA